MVREEKGGGGADAPPKEEVHEGVTIGNIIELHRRWPPVRS
jgi:hypothetical protein